ncbi:accessory Sec system S-layer assembly protein [Texcoconibacillus texcoconensis]|uniref:Accessory Sec system S-layer assembly protein n=1 Tax=Texcoconibacillus texcoconensis TaxID=1095777 RepID=A0A840QR66_9BACI|nr:accessory Sec system S-layer assembly protein [Texcoconibacillus texcoconensis]MBB5173787.1 accessory Sec system S-layer assembly protein [Texcoconibacillus texcoconensis]
MLPFFKKNKDNEHRFEGKESTVSSEDFVEESDSNVDENGAVETDLSIHPEWQMPKEDVYAFQFLNLECPHLKPNQLSLAGIQSEETEDSFQFTVFIRQSLSKTIRLWDATIVLLGENDEVLGRKNFDLTDLGELPPTSSRPWTFEFKKDELFSTEVPSEGWKLAFQKTPSSRKHSLDLADSWEKSLATKDLDKLKEMVEGMEPPKPGELNFLGLKAKFQEEGSLHITLLIRNGSQKTVNLEQVPLLVEDASGEVIAKGGFKLEEFSIKGNTSKPWTFVFPAELIQKQDPDLSTWKVYPPQKKA